MAKPAASAKAGLGPQIAPSRPKLRPTIAFPTNVRAVPTPRPKPAPKKAQDTVAIHVKAPASGAAPNVPLYDAP